MFRKMKDDDLDAVIAIEKESFAAPWSPDDFRYELNGNPCSQLFVKTEAGRVVAFADLWIMFDKAEIANIAVAADCRHQGIGASLMEYLEKKAVRAGCESISLEVRVNNEAARRLYEKQGYVKAVVRKDYYADHTDAYLMVKGI